MTSPPEADPTVRRADVDDTDAIGRLLYDFNREFEEPTPDPAALALRIRQLIVGGDTTVLLGGRGPDGFVLLRVRPAIWSPSLECSLAELYVVPNQRGHGLGRRLVEAAIAEAQRQGADHIELATGDRNHAARGLYESLGFTNCGGGSINYFYQRELH